MSVHSLHTLEGSKEDAPGFYVLSQNSPCPRAPFVLCEERVQESFSMPYLYFLRSFDQQDKAMCAVKEATGTRLDVHCRPGSFLGKDTWLPAAFKESRICSSCS